MVSSSRGEITSENVTVSESESYNPSGNSSTSSSGADSSAVSSEEVAYGKDAASAYGLGAIASSAARAARPRRAAAKKATGVHRRARVPAVTAQRLTEPWACCAGGEADGEAGAVKGEAGRKRKGASGCVRRVCLL
jgi:hypothetical protein